MAVDLGTVHEDEAVAQPPLIGLTLPALILSIGFCIIASYWIEWSEVVTFFCQVTEAVPAVPAVAVLILLVVLNPLVRRISHRLALDRREVLMVYVFLTVATSMAGCGIVRFFINTIPVPFYFATAENEFESIQQYIPEWMVPHDSETLRLLYEASEEGRIPWRPWLVPLAAWGVFFLALWVTMMAMMAIFHRQWADKEKLTYPLLYLPVELTEGLNTGALVADFFRNPIMWIGFALAFIYNITNIINSYDPGFTALGKYYDIGALFTERPWSAIQPFQLHYRPEMIGFGYLVSTEVALSIWLFSLLLRLEAVAAAGVGLDVASFPFVQEQGLGSYLAVAIFLIWVARGHIAGVLRKAFRGDPQIDDSREPMSYRWAVILFVVGLGVVLAWVNAAGMALWVAALYFALILAVALVYARIRAEVGVPLIWMFPYYQHYKFMKYVFGSAPLQVGGSWRTLTTLTTLVFLSRGYFPSLIGYQAEGYRLADEVRIRPRAMSWLLVLALIVGFYVSVWLHLRAYYMYGSGGLTSLGGWGYAIASSEYEELVGYAKGHASPDPWRIGATAAGFLATAALTILRMIFLRFPLHPLALGMAGSYGSLIWGSFFIVWLVKSIVFKLGGMSAYKRLIPGFLGLALGHYFTAGILWGLIGTFGGESLRRYYVYFG
jgi:hypothetical protein